MVVAGGNRRRRVWRALPCDDFALGSGLAFSGAGPPWPRPEGVCLGLCVSVGGLWALGPPGRGLQPPMMMQACGT